MDDTTIVDDGEPFIDLVLPVAGNRASDASGSAEEEDGFQYDGDSEWSPLRSNSPADNPGHSHDDEDHDTMHEWGAASSTDSPGNDCCDCFVRVFRSPEGAFKVPKRTGSAYARSRSFTLLIQRMIIMIAYKNRLGKIILCIANKLSIVPIAQFHAPIQARHYVDS